MAKALSRKVTIYINGKEIENTLSSLKGEMVKLQNQQKKMVIGSEEYIQTSLKIKEIKSVLTEQEKAVRDLGTDWEKTREAAAQYGNILEGLKTATGKIAGVYDWAKGYVEEAAKMDDAYADVMKTTGLTHDEVLRLNEAFKQMDTRTAREELNKLASEAGKLGITGVDAVTSFTAAADKIRVALGEDLGEDATTVIGKMADIYTRSTKELSDAGDDLGAKMLRIGSAINSLGAASSAAEPHMVDFLARLGGMASQAGLSAQQVLGYASALDQSGVSVEKSATAFQNFMAKMMQKPAEFAAIARQGVNEFRQLMETDMDAAIKAVLAGLNEEGGMTKLAPLFKDLQLSGQGVTTMLTTLKGSIDKVNEAQTIANAQMSSGASIEDEFAVKNNTLQAQAEKAKKAFEDMRLELGNELYPIIIHITKTGTVGLKLLKGVIDACKENKIAVLGVVAAILALNGARIKSLYYHARELAAEKLGIASKKLESIQNAMTAASEARLNLQRQKAELATLKQQLAVSRKIIADKAEYVAIGANNVVLAAERNARFYATQIEKQQTVVTNAHTAAVKAQKAAMASLPWGAILVAAGLVVNRLVKLKNAEGEAAEANRELARKQAEVAEASIRMRNQIDQDIARIDALRNSHGDEAKVLGEMNEKYGEVFGRYSSLAEWYDVLTKKSEDYVHALFFQAQAQQKIDDAASIGKLIDEYKKLDKEEVEGAKNLNAFEGTLVRVGGFFEGLGNKVGAFVAGLQNTPGQLNAISNAVEAAGEVLGPVEQITQNLEDIDTYNANNQNNKIKDLQVEQRELLQGATELAEQAEELSRKTGFSLSSSGVDIVADTATGTAGGGPEDKASAKAREAWSKVVEDVGEYISKLETKTKSGLSGVVSEVERESDRLRQSIVEGAGSDDEKNNLIASLDKAVGEMRKKKVMEYLSKAGDEAEKMRKEFSRPGDEKMFDDVKTASAKLEESLRAIDEKVKDLGAAKDDLVAKKEAAASDELKASIQRDIDAIDQVISQYRSLSKEVVSSVYRGIGEKVDTSKFSPEQRTDDGWKSLMAQVDRNVAENADRWSVSRKASEEYRQKLVEIAKEYDELNRKLEKNKAVELEVKKAIEERIEGERKKQPEQQNAALIANLESEAAAHQANADAIDQEAEKLKKAKEEKDELAKSDSLKKTFKDWVGLLSDFSDRALTIFSNINKILDNIAESSLKREEEAKDESIKNLDEQLDQGLMSQEEYDKRKLEIEEDFSAKEKEIQLEQWRREKELNITQALMSAALAAIQVWADAEMPNWAKVALSAALAGEMATNIAAIESQPEPYAKGGYVKEKTYFMAGEAGEEWVASNALLRDSATAPIVDVLEQYQRGNRDALSRLRFARPNFTVASDAAARWSKALGGAPSVSRGSTDEVVSLLKELSVYLRDPNNRRAVISRRMQEDFDRNENFLRSSARL